MAQERVLIVEDEENERTGLAELVTSWGYRTDTAADGVEALEKVALFAPSIVITDVKMPRMDGIELAERLSQLAQTVAVVIVTAQKTTETAFHAGRLGVQDYIEKPIDFRRLRSILTNIGEILEARTESESLRRRLRDKGALGLLVGSSAPMQEIFRLIEMVAPSTASVLITGASGTGKELVARTIHDLSPRRNKPFVPINCAAIPETLIESEIFGHEKGAFTGAIERRTGCFELAEGGTLLLDEIGEMPVGTQAKLLRVLEDRKLRRLGSRVETSVDVRVLAATNKVPDEAVAAGQLREDLYYRLNVFNINMPALREHKEDIRELAKGLLQDMNQKHGRKSVRRERSRSECFSELFLARQRARAAQYSRESCDRVRGRIGRNQAPASRFWAECEGRRKRSGCGASWRGHDGRRSGEIAHPENAAGHEQQQDARRGDPGNQPEDTAQQAKGIWPAAGCRAGGRVVKFSAPSSQHHCER